MSMNSQIDLSKLCGRKISDEEGARIREVAASMELRDDDALWQLLAAIEYQKTYYEKIPKRIEKASDKLLENIKEAAEKEVEKSQAILARSVVDQAKKLSFSMKIEIILPLVIAGMIIFIGYGAVMQWTGFNMASGKYHPIKFLLYFDIGGLILGLIISLSSILSLLGIMEYINNTHKWKDEQTLRYLLYFILSTIGFSISYSLFNLLNQ